MDQHLFVLIHIRDKGEVGAIKHNLSPPVTISTDRSKAVLLLWIRFVNCVSSLLFLAAL